jgi:hypothetical protein
LLPLPLKSLLVKMDSQLRHSGRQAMATADMPDDLPAVCCALFVSLFFAFFMHKKAGREINPGRLKYSLTSTETKTNL